MGKFGLFLALLVSFFGCSASHQPEPSASHVRIYTTDIKLDSCKYLGEVISTEGVWYNYWFISNYNLTKGARDGLRNQAHALGGNVIHVEKSYYVYTTSTVFVGNVYHCPLNSDKH
ncbi:MAG: DUF4156 domain-containing protein [Sulfurimonadaceae bacterium]